MAWHAALAVAVLAAATEGNDVFLKGKDGKHENQIRVGKSTAMTKVRQRLFNDGWHRRVRGLLEREAEASRSERRDEKRGRKREKKE